jgi:hypothetical protein
MSIDEWGMKDANLIKVNSKFELGDDRWVK